MGMAGDARSGIIFGGSTSDGGRLTNNFHKYEVTSDGVNITQLMY